MKRITVFCGSGSGSDAAYIDEARELGVTLAAKGIGLVYGGAKIGLMGAVADAVMNAGGKVTGVLPGFLQKREVAHEGLTELIIVESMHERKLRMHELSDGIIALPGGYGTLEELFEMLTWSQLGLHSKPIGILNTAGFYDGLIAFIDHMLTNGFLSPANRQMLLIGTSVQDLLKKMEEHKGGHSARGMEKKV